MTALLIKREASGFVAAVIKHSQSVTCEVCCLFSNSFFLLVYSIGTLFTIFFSYLSFTICLPLFCWFVVYISNTEAMSLVSV